MSIDLTQYGYPSASEAKAKLFAAMKECGVSYLEAYYSGGNDEGGVDDIEVMKDDRGEAVTIDNLNWQHPLMEACDRMLSVEFGSWAGDFSASGMLYADRSTGKVERKGQQSAYHDDSHEY